MKTLFQVCVAVILALFCIALPAQSQQFISTLEGKVVGKEVDSLYLYKATADFRNEAAKTIILVSEGRFSTKIRTDKKEAYKIIFPYQLRQGSWRPVEFFAEPGKISFTLYPEENTDSIEGGALTEAYTSFMQKMNNTLQLPVESIYQKIDSLRERGEYYSEAALEIRRRIEESDNSDEKSELYEKLNILSADHSDKTAKAKKHALKVDSLYNEYKASRQRYVDSHASPVSFYMVYEDARSIENDAEALATLKEDYRRHVEALPDHPYAKIVGDMIAAHQQIKVGSTYTDFTLPDIEGNSIRLSDEVQGKIALINFWASWCGPCIRKSREMVPIYKKYHGEDFTMIGIAREFEDTSKLKQAQQREQFPWKNLVELDDSKNIWLKYDMPYSGGGMVLVDREGTILAINPTAEKVSDVLTKRL